MTKMLIRSHAPRITHLLTVSLAVTLIPAVQADGPFSKLFGGKGKTETISSSDDSGTVVVVEPVNGKAPEVTHAAAPSAEQRPDFSSAYPRAKGPEVRISKSEEKIESMIDSIYAEYEGKVQKLTASDLQLTSTKLLDPVPADYSEAWGSSISRRFWDNERAVKQNLEQVYAQALQHSNTVKVFSDVPLIRETGIREAKGEFDWRLFAQGQYQAIDEPTSSELDTGFTGRLLEDRAQLDYGLRKKLGTGAEISISNRLGTLESNSQFVTPNPQTTSEIVLSIVQPLARGAGYHYNLARMKVARMDADMAAAEFVRALESHLLEVNRAYWEVFLARAAYLQQRAIVDDTRSTVTQLQERTEAGADEALTESALLRAESSLAQREASLIRGEMSIRNAEERLRALVNDPDFAMGSGGEFVPMTAPIVSPPSSDVKAAARAALYHRPEVVQGFHQLRIAGIRRDVQENELKPQLNLVAETSVSGLDEGRQIGDPMHDQFSNGAGWIAGFTFEQSLGRNTQFARLDRRELELRQQANQLRATIDTVLLESVVTYRELMTSYRDMQARYKAVESARKEVKTLKERYDEGAGGDQVSPGGQLQLILDALERQQTAENSFLVSVVAYNTAFASVERAKGTFLDYHDIEIERQKEESWKRHRQALNSLDVAMGTSPGIGSSEGGVDGVSVSGGATTDWDRHRAALESLKNQ